MVNLDAKESIEPILMIKNEIMASPKNSIKEMASIVTDIRIIKEASLLDTMEFID